MNKHDLSSSKSEQSFNNVDCDAASENLRTNSGDEQWLFNTSQQITFRNNILYVAHGCVYNHMGKKYYWYQFYVPSYDPAYKSPCVDMFSIESTVETASRHNCLYIFKDFAISAFTVYAESARCMNHRQSKTCMDWKRRLKLHDIRDTLYFKPCNFTLNTL